jgi:hypothetical protein
VRVIGRLRRRWGVIRYALQAFLERLESFAKSFTQFRKLLASKKQDSQPYDDDDVPRLKDFHTDSPLQMTRTPGCDPRTLLSHRFRLISQLHLLPRRHAVYILTMHIPAQMGPDVISLKEYPVRIRATGVRIRLLDVETGRPMQKAMKALACLCAVAATTLAAGKAQGQGKLAAAAPVTYDNKYEIYGGINLMNFQAGQDLPKRMNMGGIEVLGTYWLTNKIGLGAQYRGEAGTTDVLPSARNINGTVRPLVVLHSGLFGLQYRGPKNQHAAINYHAYGGAAYGDFTESGLVGDVGLYQNHTAPLVALGASVDFNRSKNLALRLSPDLILEHFGTETREFFAISGGIVYRFGQK